MFDAAGAGEVKVSKEILWRLICFCGALIAADRKQNLRCAHVLCSFVALPTILPAGRKAPDVHAMHSPCEAL